MVWQLEQRMGWGGLLYGLWRSRDAEERDMWAMNVYRPTAK